MASTHDSLPPTETARLLVAQHARRVGVAVLVGAAFAGGAIFAEAQAKEAEAPAIDDVLARAEARTERLEEVQAELELRYHQELTSPPLEVPPPAAPPAPERARPAEPAQAEVSSHGADGEAEAPSREPEAPKPAEEPDPRPEEPEQPPTLDEPEPAPAGQSDRLARAFLDVMGDDAPPLVRVRPEDAAPPEAPAPERYTVQVGSFPSAESAETLVAEYRRKGYRVAVRTAVVNGRKVHRVQLGDFATRDEAVEHRRQVEAREGVLSLVVRR